MPGVIENSNLKYLEERNRAESHWSDEEGLPNMKMGSRNRFPNGYSSDQMSDVTTDDGPRYLLEHLATFSVGSDFGIVTPKDGLRRLLQMEKSNGIWTQKMQMKLDKNWVLILDYEDGDVVEKFPMNLISDPTAYTSEDSRELYNNILIFIVREDSKNKNPSQSEMHIFQCSKVYAQDVVDEMKMFISGKIKTKAADNVRYLPPPPHNPPPDPPINGNSSKVREHVAMFSASTSSSSLPHPPPTPRGGSVLQQRIERVTGYAARESNDETSSTSSDKYEREVTILNHCFDDIERFVVRLQHSAAAYKELQRRQKNRKHKKKDMGDGMLSIRAKPPPEREFVDVFQKFKLSFNLLAKLKSHIHDPNAPELVHFLFTPLALIIDAARDSKLSANLTANVVSPLLTRDAIELLGNCCTSKETDLWHSLGDAWIIPRDQWKGYESTYRPVFSNGWSPENPIEDGTLSHRLQRSEVDLREQDYQRVFSHQERDPHFGSEYFGSERDDHEAPNVVPDHHPHNRPSFERPYEHMPLEARREFLERDNTLSPESVFHDPRDRDLRSEFSSDSIEHGDLPLSPERQFDRQQIQWLEDLKSRHAKIVQVVYPRTANNEKELTVIRGEILEVIDDSRKWWKARNMRGMIAHVPHTIVTPYPSIEDDIVSNPVYGSRSSVGNYYSTDTSTLKEHYLDEGTTRSQETSRSPANPGSRPAPADWIRRERQGHLPESPRMSFPPKSDFSPLPSPPAEHATFELQELNHSPPNWFPPPPTEAETNPKRNISGFQRYNSQGFISAATTEAADLASDSSLSPSKPRSKTSKQTADPSQSLDRRTRSQTSDSQISDAALELFQEELKASINQKKGLKVWRKITCPEHDRTDCYYINVNSTRNEVMHWLKLKGFSERALEVLKAISTEMLFKLKKDQLEKYLDSEGIKLFNHLQVQKNMSGYKTFTSQELAEILAQRKQKTESFDI